MWPSIAFRWIQLSDSIIRRCDADESAEQQPGGIKDPPDATTELLSPHQGAVQRLAEVPGLGADSAHQILFISHL